MTHILFSLLYLITPTNAIAGLADTVMTVNSGAVFLYGIDLGAPPFLLSIENDSLRINGYPILPGMIRPTPEPRLSDQQRAFGNLDRRADTLAASLRRTSGMTQQTLTRRMTDFYQHDPLVESVTEINAATGCFTISLRSDGSTPTFPYGRCFRLKTLPHWSTYNPRADQQQKLRQYADLLRGNGTLVFAEGGCAVYWKRGPDATPLTQRLRNAVQRKSAGALANLEQYPDLPVWLPVLFGNPIPLPLRR